MHNRVRELRKERKMLQGELAGKLNVSQQTISRIENGDNSLPADILIDLAKFFGVSVDYILYLSDSRRTLEYQMEFNMLTEKNYNFCRLYDRLTKVNQELLYRLAEQLDASQNSKGQKK